MGLMRGQACFESRLAKISNLSFPGSQLIGIQRNLSLSFHVYLPTEAADLDPQYNDPNVQLPMFSCQKLGMHPTAMASVGK